MSLDATAPTVTTASTDPRLRLAQAQAWVAELLDHIRPDQLGLSTPCDDYDVRALLEHLFAVENRIAVVAETGSVEGTPRSVPLPEGDLGTAFRAAAARVQAAWADDARLASVYALPWGQETGAAAVLGYVGEHVTHGWDLATALGLPSEADAELAEVARRSYDGRVHPEPRGGFVPFGSVVEPDPAAGPTERLANYLGRRSR